MTEQEAIDYYNKLVTIIRSDKYEIEMNSDRVHNSVIMSAMLDTSNKICMYCGEMSVFRTPFYNHIENDDNNQEGLGDFLKSRIIKSMTEFIKRENVNLQVILEKKISEFPANEIIFGDNFLEAIKNGKIKISYLNPNIVFNSAMSHFTFTSKSVRMEKDKKEHTAIFSINAPDKILEDYHSHFDNLKEAAIPLCI